MKIAIAGAHGFVGRHVREAVSNAGWDMRLLSREELNSDDVSLIQAIHGCDWLVNCAGSKVVSQKQHRYANEKLPSRLAEAAGAAKCIGLVHISSVAAARSVTTPGVPVGDQDAPAPDNEYGRSKLRGEVALLNSIDSRLAIIVLRPPLLYGPKAKGLFGVLASAARRGVPLPFRGHNNSRDLMHVQNLAIAVIYAIRANVSGCFFVGDGTTLSPQGLYREMLRVNGFADRTFSIGRFGRNILKALSGRRGDSLYAESHYDWERFAQMTGYQPVLAPRDALRQATIDRH